MMQRQARHGINLHTRDLACGRGETILVRDLSLSVPPGEALLLRGANGVGKSTLLLTLAGLLRPMAGTFAFGGADPDDGPFRHYCGHKNAVRSRQSVLETLRFWVAINGSGGLTPEAALERTGLGRATGLDAGYLSAGQQRRLVLARLLVSPRAVWLLDEPSAALDADGQALLTELLAEHLDTGGLAIIATHDEITLPRSATLELGTRP
ncbi:heme ABC exporter ATP-binding protein CcmA [Devosia sp. Naph2]|uniref:heme ABC exporter ATP-binding protein CcmA n=1 Tax=Devosia polycyclovorans TaxID=3345148 RepID=UPI0035CEB1BD